MAVNPVTGTTATPIVARENIPVPPPRTWTVGQVIQAFVVSRLNDQTATLRIGNEQLTARTPQPVGEGANLKLLVTRLGDVPVLQIVPLDLPLTLTEADLAVKDQALRTALPRQMPLSSLVSFLSDALQGSAPGEGPQSPQTAAQNALRQLPPQLAAQVMNFFANLPNAEALKSPEALTQAILNSGAFLEANLAAGNGQAVRSDLKASLFKLAAAISAVLQQTDQGADVGAPPKDLPATYGRNAPVKPDVTLIMARAQHQDAAQLQAEGAGSAPATTTHHGTEAGQAEGPRQGAAPMAGSDLRQTATSLAREVESALARITSQQLQSLPNNQSPMTAWTMDVPFRDGDRGGVAEFHIERDGRQQNGENGESGPAWNITVTLDLGDHGPMHTRVAVAGERVNTQIWAEKPATLALIQRELQGLREQFQQAGLTPDGIVLRQGTPAVVAETLPPGGSDLINLRV
jgi:hypothetical protein